MSKKEKQTMTAREFAEAIERPYTTVLGWLQKQLIPGARLVESPIGAYYEIPVVSTQNFTPPKAGRPPKQKQAGEANSKLAKKRVTKKAK